MCIGVLLLLCSQAPEPVDWPRRLQAPYEKLPVGEIGLRPLLVDEGGKAITTREGWQRRRQALHEQWQKRLGTAPPVPEKLDVRIEKREKLDDHTRVTLSFHAEGTDRINAYLLEPNGLKENERRPAVVVFHQTTRDRHNEPVGLGKNPTLALALHLVKRGYVALSPECYILKDGWALSQSKVLAERRPGWTGMGKMTFDGSRCVDYLETLPSVDGKRIGCIGHSLGAKEVLYAMAFEPRYRAGVFSEGGIGLRMSNWTDPWYLTEAMNSHIPALENHQVLAFVAPRPFLLLGGDSADGDASWTFIEAVRPVYRLFDSNAAIGMHNHRAKHTMPTESRRLAYEWLDYWLEHRPSSNEVGP